MPEQREDCGIRHKRALRRDVRLTGLVMKRGQASVLMVVYLALVLKTHNTEACPVFKYLRDFVSQSISQARHLYVLFSNTLLMTLSDIELFNVLRFGCSILIKQVFLN